MEKLPRQQYTKEFREQAVKLVSERALTVPEAAKRLSMSGQTLRPLMVSTVDDLAHFRPPLRFVSPDNGAS